MYDAASASEVNKIGRQLDKDICQDKIEYLYEKLVEGGNVEGGVGRSRSKGIRVSKYLRGDIAIAVAGDIVLSFNRTTECSLWSKDTSAVK